MLHLFNKVYVASDSAIDLNHDRVVISNEMGVQLLGDLDKVTQGALLAYSKSLSELYSNNNIKDFGGLISYLNSHQNTHDKVIIIYLDDVNFMEFMSTWFKTIFKQIDSDAAWKIIDCFMQKNKKYLGWNHTTNSKLDEWFEGVTKETFVGVFSNAVSSNDNSIFADIKKHLSLEYLIASYLMDNTQTAELSSSLKNIITRTLQENMIEVKFIIYKNINKKTFNYDIDMNLFTNSSLFKSEVLGKLGSTSNIDLLGASQVDIDKFIAIAKQIYIDWEGFNESSSVFKLMDLIEYVRKDLTKDDIDFILNFEKTQKSNDRIYSTTDEEKINVYLLELILDEETALLEKLILR